MAERVTKGDIVRAFKNYMAVMGKRPARDHRDVGGWLLDYNPTYGGYVIEEIFNEAGAITWPIDGYRRSPREFLNTLRFATRSVELAKRQY